MEEAVQNLFRRYERFFAQGLAGDFDETAARALYAPEFIAAWSGGVKAGKNNGALIKALRKDLERNRELGTQAMRAQRVDISPIGAHHVVALVAWAATYRRDDLPETVIEFDVHYLVQLENGEAKVFGWVVGDEQALLKQHGVI